MIVRSVAATISVAAVLLGHGVGAAAAEVKVLCANGMRAVLTELHPQLERTTGQRVTMNFGEAGHLRTRIQEPARAIRLLIAVGAAVVVCAHGATPARAEIFDGSGFQAISWNMHIGDVERVIGSGVSRLRNKHNDYEYLRAASYHTWAVSMNCS